MLQGIQSVQQGQEDLNCPQDQEAQLVLEALQVHLVLEVQVDPALQADQVDLEIQLDPLCQMVQSVQ